MNKRKKDSKTYASQVQRLLIGYNSKKRRLSFFEYAYSKSKLEVMDSLEKFLSYCSLHGITGRPKVTALLRSSIPHALRALELEVSHILKRLDLSQVEESNYVYRLIDVFRKSPSYPHFVEMRVFHDYMSNTTVFEDRQFSILVLGRLITNTGLEVMSSLKMDSDKSSVIARDFIRAIFNFSDAEEIASTSLIYVDSVKGKLAVSELNTCLLKEFHVKPEVKPEVKTDSEDVKVDSEESKVDSEESKIDSPKLGDAIPTSIEDIIDTVVPKGVSQTIPKVKVRTVMEPAPTDDESIVVDENSIPEPEVILCHQQDGEVEEPKVETSTSSDDAGKRNALIGSLIKEAQDRINEYKSRVASNFSEYMWRQIEASSVKEIAVLRSFGRGLERVFEAHCNRFAEVELPSNYCVGDSDPSTEYSDRKLSYIYKEAAEATESGLDAIYDKYRNAVTEAITMADSCGVAEIGGIIRNKMTTLWDTHCRMGCDTTVDFYERQMADAGYKVKEEKPEPAPLSDKEQAKKEKMEQKEAKRKEKAAQKAARLERNKQQREEEMKNFKRKSVSVSLWSDLKKAVKKEAKRWVRPGSNEVYVARGKKYSLLKEGRVVEFLNFDTSVEEGMYVDAMEVANTATNTVAQTGKVATEFIMLNECAADLVATTTINSVSSTVKAPVALYKFIKYYSCKAIIAIKESKDEPVTE